MPFVNLIKEDRLAAAIRDRKIRLLALACVAISAVSFVGAAYFTFEAARQNSKVAQLEQTKKRIQPYIDQVNKNQAEIDKLRPRMQTLTSAQGRTQQWSRILDHLSHNMPKGVWLTRVSCQRMTPADPVQVSLTGLSTTNEAVGYLIIRLEASEDLQDSELVFTQERRTEKGKALEFEIKGKLVGSAPAKKTKEADEA
ncbi:MAG: PilN domain-containing protein [Armatimonadetes bacterium]|nr:PilN domain-containing protein [Armatimonadota bacterium]